MGKFFSDPVETALQYIYYENRTGGRRGKEGFDLLTAASQAGDGDADCVLARCLSGTQYVWSGHHFPEDDQKVMKLLHRSIERGSALGVLVAKRSGAFTPVWQSRSPLTLQQAFQLVLEKAAGGDAFCQYTIANTYFWWDFLSIQGKSREDFPDPQAFQAYMTQEITKCEDWFWRAFRGGMYLAGNNLYNYYLKGDEGYVAPQPEKAAEIFKIGAEMGYPLHQKCYADDLKEAGDLAGAAHWYLQAAENGQPGLWYNLGEAYLEAKGVERDIPKAVFYYQKAMEEGSIGGYNAMGDLYYRGLGVPQDRAKAFECFHYVNEHSDNKYCYPFLAVCYLEGWGTAPDYERAYNLAWETKDWAPRSRYALGRIYGEGLGMPADIPKGVDFLQRAGDLPEAVEELKHYKKTLFGRWVRR